jgi:hypothetical protein
VYSESLTKQFSHLLIYKVDNTVTGIQFARFNQPLVTFFYVLSQARRSASFMSKPLKSIPKFTSEPEERAFWEQQDSTDYLDWKTAQRVVLPNLKPSTKTISLRLVL